MNKALFYLILFMLFFVSCKKSTSVAPANTISATIDGADESFNTNAVAQLGTEASLNSNLTITGTNGSASGADGLAITINNNATITAGTYTNKAGSNTGFTSILYSKGVYNPSNPVLYTSDVNGVYITTINITSVSSTNIQGTFSGQLLFTDGKTIKTLTNGKFNVTVNN